MPVGTAASQTHLESELPGVDTLYGYIRFENDGSLTRTARTLQVEASAPGPSHFEAIWISTVAVRHGCKEAAKESGLVHILLNESNLSNMVAWLYKLKALGLPGSQAVHLN